MSWGINYALYDDVNSKNFFDLPTLVWDLS